LVPAVEWGSDRVEKTITSKSASFGRLAGNPAQGVQGGKMAHSLRSMGSAALNFAMVAQGGLDLYWYYPSVPLKLLVNR
jgi:myo-inositol-1(or 4)-monophosphatase